MRGVLPPASRPRGLLVRAALLVGLFGVLHAFGLRTRVGVLTATATPETKAIVLAIVYVAAWFGAIGLAPILVLASGVLALLDRALPDEPPPDQAL